MFELTPFLITQSHELRQPSPVLMLFDVSIPNGPVLHYVDFYDADCRGSAPGKVPFNGQEYDPVAITVGEIAANTDGTGGGFPIAILDPLHQVAFYLRTHDWLEGARVKMWVTTYDRLSDPSKASVLDLVVVRSSLTQGPDTATLVFGSWGIYEERIPFNFYDRGKCSNNYQNRHTVRNFAGSPPTSSPPRRSRISSSAGASRKRSGSTMVDATGSRARAVRSRERFRGAGATRGRPEIHINPVPKDIGLDQAAPLRARVL